MEAGRNTLSGREAEESLAARFIKLSLEERLAYLGSLSEADAETLIYDWAFWARPAQLPPPGDWFCWLIMAGRGFGKTRTGAEWVIARMKSGRFGHAALIGETAADVRDVMIEAGESSILKISPPWFMPVYEPSKRRLTWPNGAIAIAYSGEDPDQLRGPQHDTAWTDEPAKWKYADETWSNMEFGLRLGPQPQACATTTPRPTKLIRDLVQDPQTVVTSGSTYDNYANLSPNFIQRVVKRYEGTRLGLQELHAKLLTDVPGALWKRSMIDALRVRSAPSLIRVVVGVDPAVSDSTAEDADEAGILIVGLAENGHAYVLEDKSLQGGPLEWASAAIAGYWEHQADRIAAEVNNGGEMVILTIKSVDQNVATKKLWASRGKYTRAEPIAAFYEQGFVHHVGAFAELEDELCNWVPTSGKSPNRLDALVWALTELMVEGDGGFGAYSSAGESRGSIYRLGG
ncbi:MAG: terminase family protein [Armatimonadota bacterium]